jgi:hypothetical protein
MSTVVYRSQGDSLEGLVLFCDVVGEWLRSVAVPERKEPSESLGCGAP